MKEKLTHNLGLKIRAVVLAVCMCLIMVNVSNPLETGTQEVPVEIINKEILEKSGLTYEMVGKNTVTVSYSVRVRDKNRISASDFYAYADLAELYDVTGAIPVKVEVKNREASSMIEDGPSVRPGVVRITTEKLQTKRFTLRKTATGETEDEYVVGQISLNPESVYVTGATSVVGQISAAGVEIPVDGANGDLEGTAVVRFYDANGNLLNNLGDSVEVNVKDIHYTASILKVKNLSLNYRVTGQVADGYRFTGVESDVTSVPVAGLKSALATINNLEVSNPELDLTGATSDVAVQIDLAELLPDNLTLAGDTSTVANVVLKVEPLVTRTLSYDLDDVIVSGQREHRSYEFDRESMDLRVRGLKEDLDVLNVRDILVALDVSDYTIGSHVAIFSIQLPDGFELMGRSAVTMSVEAEVGPGLSEEELAAALGESISSEEESASAEETEAQQ